MGAPACSDGDVDADGLDVEQVAVLLVGLPGLAAALHVLEAAGELEGLQRGLGAGDHQDSHGDGVLGHDGPFVEGSLTMSHVDHAKT